MDSLVPGSSFAGHLFITCAVKSCEQVRHATGLGRLPPRIFHLHLAVFILILHQQSDALESRSSSPRVGKIAGQVSTLLEVEAEEVGRGQLERDAHSGASPRRHVHAAHSRTSFSGPGD